MIALGWMAAAVIAVLGMLWAVQRSLIYLPSGAVPAPPPQVESVTLVTEDGLELSAWFIEAPDERATVIVFNGNAGNRAHRLPLGEALSERGLSVLLTDYRGYGGNPGSPSEDGLALDARAARAYVDDRRGNGPVAYFGESLGAGVAIGLAIQAPPVALVLRSPFTSLPEIASVHYPWVPTGLLLRDRFPNRERIEQLDVPVLVIAGSEDGIVPPAQSRAVYDAASDPKQILEIPGTGHNDRAMLDGEELIETVVDFVTRSAKGDQP